MAKHLDKFSKPFQHSRIPFLLAEVVTNGSGEMVDLVCRAVNPPAASLLGQSAAELRGQRFTRLFPPERLAELAPLQAVAFSGSAASFSCTTLLGREVSITCYQPMYGLAACILEAGHDGFREPEDALAELLPGAQAVLELSRSGVRCISFHQNLCGLTGWTRRELLDRGATDFSALVEPADWQDLLQALLDAAREDRRCEHPFRLQQKDGGTRWAELRAIPLASQSGTVTFSALVLDIHPQRTAREQRDAALAQLNETQIRWDQLLEGLPGRSGLFHTPPGGAGPEPLGVSQGLADLLGYSRRELIRRLAADSLWRVPAADRKALEDAAVQARQAGLPLRQELRVRPKGGGERWLGLEAVWQTRPDGDLWIYVTCADITAEKKALEALRAQSQLLDLLLDHSRLVSFDYDPAADLARVETFDAAGRRTARTIPGYLDALPENGAIHPEDRKRLAAAIRRTCSRPGTETAEYRADYDGQGWRWYRGAWVSLFDAEGDVCRLVGKAEDISGQRASAQRFQALTGQYRKLTKGTLALLRLDLSGDRILDIRSGDRRLTRTLFGNTAEACLRHLGDSIPDPDQQARFRAMFQPGLLLEAFRRGDARFVLEHRLTLDRGAARVRLTAELAQAPDTRHVTAFCRLEDLEGRRQRNAALEALARDYDFVLTVDTASGGCRLHSGAEVPDGTTYRALAARYLRTQVPSHQRTALRRECRLENLLAHLAEAPSWSLTRTLETPDGPQAKTLRCAWLDQDTDLLLVTLGRA